jgi:outer membrane assembly lipoprotein YfiO
MLRIFALLVFATALFGKEKKTYTPAEYYSFMQEAVQDKDWWAAVDYGEILLKYFPDSPFSQDVLYDVGLAYVQMDQFEQADGCFTQYLRQSGTPKRFEEAIHYKFQIAEHFAHEGGKLRPFGTHKLPEMFPAQDEAIRIYDDVITTLPHHDIAARSLIGKAEMQISVEDYKPAVETLQLLIRRFPKHDLAAQGYLEINKAYLKQCETQHLDPELLDLARVNLRKFKQAFPREKRIEEAEHSCHAIEELFAAHLLEIGDFYDRTSKENAAAVYYKKILTSYPDTKTAKKAEKALARLEHVEP